MAVAGARPAAAMAAASVAVTTRVVASLAVVGTEAVAMHECDHGGNEEEDGVHDSQGPARLEHGAGLIGVPVVVGPADGHISNFVVPVVPTTDIGAVSVGDAAQIPHAGDKGADEAEIYQADEHGIGRRPVVAKQGEDGPCDSKDGHDEEDEDGVGGERIVVHEAVNEPGEHAHDGNLRCLSASRKRCAAAHAPGEFMRQCGATYQSYDLKDPEADEEECEEHDGGVDRFLLVVVNAVDLRRLRELLRQSALALRGAR